MNVAQEEAWEASCLAWPVWTSFPQCPRPCQLHIGSGDSFRACNKMSGLEQGTEKGSWVSPGMVQTLITQTLSQANPTAITAEEYFNPNFELGNRDMGRPMELTTKTQK